MVVAVVVPRPITRTAIQPATKEEFVRFKAAARATAIKDRRVNIRLSSGDLRDIQVRALEEGVPYQTLIASVLHRYVTGRLADRPAAGAQERRRTANRSARTGKSASPR